MVAVVLSAADEPSDRTWLASLAMVPVTPKRSAAGRSEAEYETRDLYTFSYVLPL